MPLPRACQTTLFENLVKLFLASTQSRIAPLSTMDYDQIMKKNPILPKLPSRRSLLMGVLSLYLTPVGAHAADQSVEHVTSPRILGEADAPIKVIELFSMTCSHCASFHNNTFPDVRKRLIDTGMVRFEMQPFPLDQVARAHALPVHATKQIFFNGIYVTQGC